MSSYMLGFQDIDKTKIGVVGGKGTNLGELSRIQGILVPEGFCISKYAQTIGHWQTIGSVWQRQQLIQPCITGILVIADMQLK